MPSVELLFLGTGTSAGVPMIGCDCPVCTSADPRDKRTRPSVILYAQNTAVLIDTSPELRLQCIANNVKKIDAICYTHGHADHIMGLDDVRRFNALSGKSIDVWASPKTHEKIKTCFGYAFEGARDPAVFRPQLNTRFIQAPFDVSGVTWTPVPLLHGNLEMLGFRVGNLAYCTDVSFIPETSFQLLKGVDTLVLDGLQKSPHPTHFSVDQAIDAARRIGARQTFLTHVAHSLGHAQTIASLPPGITLAHDGLRIFSN